MNPSREEIDRFIDTLDVYGATVEEFPVIEIPLASQDHAETRFWRERYVAATQATVAYQRRFERLLWLTMTLGVLLTAAGIVWAWGKIA